MFKNVDGEIKLTKPFSRRMSTQKALEFSIQKWEFILSELKNKKDVYSHGGTRTCGLCQLFINCYDCPSIKIANKFCLVNGKEYKKNNSFRISYVRAEIKFLKSLRKK